MFIERGVSSTNFGIVQYREIAPAIENLSGITYEVRSMPHLFEETGKLYFVEGKNQDSNIISLNDY